MKKRTIKEICCCFGIVPPRHTLSRHPLSWGGLVVRWCWANFQCLGILLIWIIVGQGPTALAVGAGGGCLDSFFSRQIYLSPFSRSLGNDPI